MKVAVTGTPGTGKTEVSKELAEKLDMDRVSVNELASEGDCIQTRDERRETDVVDVDCLREEAEKLEDCILDGHLSHLLNVDYVFVLRCEPEELEERLEGKGWDEPKVRENVDAEILGMVEDDAREENGEVYSIDTTDKSPEEVSRLISKIVHVDVERNRYREKIDWMEEGMI